MSIKINHNCGFSGNHNNCSCHLKFAKQACACLVIIVVSFSQTVYAINPVTKITPEAEINGECEQQEQVYLTFNEFLFNHVDQHDATDDKTDNATVNSISGLKILSLRRTAADMMLDLRFKITNIKQAKQIMDRSTPVYLVDQDSGNRFRVPVSTKLGPLRQSTDEVDLEKNYFILFANPARSIKKCDIVTVMIGDVNVDNVIVE